MTTAGGYIKDPTAVLDYSVDWSEWLDGDTIASSSWTVPTGLTLVLSSHTDTVATAWISGGTAGTNYTIRNTVTTAAGRTDVRSIILKVRAR